MVFTYQICYSWLVRASRAPFISAYHTLWWAMNQLNQPHVYPFQYRYCYWCQVNFKLIAWVIIGRIDFDEICDGSA
jgi:hypothetical protein